MEFYGHFIEKGLGNYLKWQNFRKPQLGRIWDKDRLSVIAQAKIQSIRSSRVSEQETLDSFKSFRQLLVELEPGYSRILRKDKFLQLYYNFPGNWPENIISPYELLDIEARGNWERTILKRNGFWITISFIDGENIPVREIFISLDQLDLPLAARVQKRERLEEAGFKKERIFSNVDFIKLLKNMDPETRDQISPPSRWFFDNRYRVIRVGITDASPAKAVGASHLLGVEYASDYFIETLLIPVSLETANNLLSQFEPSGQNEGGDGLAETPTLFGTTS